MFGTGSILDQFAALFAYLATAVALDGFSLTLRARFSVKASNSYDGRRRRVACLRSSARSL